MNVIKKILSCAICGEEWNGDQRWFLVTEDRWQDKLRILHWDDYVAMQERACCACNTAHLQQLVVHWMTTGSIEHPFARLGSGSQVVRQRRVGWTARNDFGARGPKPIGELTVHRESMLRVLRENPQSLQTILDALLRGLQRETPRPLPKMDWERDPIFPREV